MEEAFELQLEDMCYINHIDMMHNAIEYDSYKKQHTHHIDNQFHSPHHCEQYKSMDVHEMELILVFLLVMELI